MCHVHFGLEVAEASTDMENEGETQFLNTFAVIILFAVIGAFSSFWVLKDVFVMMSRPL